MKKYLWMSICSVVLAFAIPWGGSYLVALVGPEWWIFPLFMTLAVLIIACVSVAVFSFDAYLKKGGGL